MLCENCGKNTATVHTMTNINGQKTEKHLCAACASQNGVISFSTGDLLKNFFTSVPSAEQTIVCSNCNTSWQDFKSTGLLGCSECFATFKENVLPIVQRVQGNVTHRGQVPKDAGEQAQKRHKLEELKGKLKDAIACENFELAATLRDEIKEEQDGKMA